MADLTLRLVKGTPLTNAEVDGNFSSLNTAKVEADDVRTLTNKVIDSVTNTVGADHIHFKVKATEAVAKGQVVKIVGYNAGENAFEVAKVSSATDVALGLVHDDLDSGEFGAVINTGLLEGFDTSAFSVGTILYPNTSGGLTATAPTTGTYQAIAYVLRSQSNNGAVLIEASEPAAVRTTNNIGNTVVLRDASGNFAAGTITATLQGNADTVTNGVYTSGAYYDPAWLMTVAASKVTGEVPIANGGTSASTAAGARTNLDVPSVAEAQNYAIAMAIALG